MAAKILIVVDNDDLKSLDKLSKAISQKQVIICGDPENQMKIFEIDPENNIRKVK